MKLEEVQTAELAEVFAINAMSPFILNGKLKPLMEKDAKSCVWDAAVADTVVVVVVDDADEYNDGISSLLIHTHARTLQAKYIVNVSAMEGKFYRHKTPNHPHTNMVRLHKCAIFSESIPQQLMTRSSFHPSERYVSILNNQQSYDARSRIHQSS